MSDPFLGMEARLYWNAGSFQSPDWQHVASARDVTLGLETGQADVTTRGNNGWRATLATLKDASISFEMMWTKDAACAALRTAFLANAPIEMLVLDGPVETPGSEGLRATMNVVNFSRGEPLEEGITLSVEVKPTLAANPPSWHTVQ